MYDTRWPRPGPAMAAVAAMFGLVVGAVLGLSSAASQPRAQASVTPQSSVAATTTTLPDRFHSVILGSFGDRANARKRLREVRQQGVEDAAILDQAEWDLGTRYAVYSGQFQTQEQARAHQTELDLLGIAPLYYKYVSRTT